MKPADPPAGSDDCRFQRTMLDGAGHRRILANPEVSPIAVVVRPVLGEQTPQVLLMKNDDVIEQLPPHRTHEALRHPVLPWTLVAGPLGSERHGSCHADHLGGEDGISVEEQVPRTERDLVEGEGLPELLDHPGGRGKLGDAPMQDLSSGVADRKPDVEKAEGGGWDHEEIHSEDHLPVVPQERPPALPVFRPPAVLPQVARNGTLGDLESELQQFPVDSSSPPTVFGGHPVHRLADLPVDGRPTRRTPRSGEPLPVQGEAGPVPGNDRLRLHDDDGVGPLRPEAAQKDPEHTVRRSDPWLVLLEDGRKLLSESEVLEDEVAPSAKP